MATTVLYPCKSGGGYKTQDFWTAPPALQAMVDAGCFYACIDV